MDEGGGVGMGGLFNNSCYNCSNNRQLHGSLTQLSHLKTIFVFSVAYWRASRPSIREFPRLYPRGSSRFSDHFPLIKRFISHSRRRPMLITKKFQWSRLKKIQYRLLYQLVFRSLQVLRNFQLLESQPQSLSFVSDQMIKGCHKFVRYPYDVNLNNQLSSQSHS